MSKITVLHLVDDTTAGGVMRMLDHLAQLPELADEVHQEVRPVKRTAFSWGSFDADVIVSHIAPGWRCLPAFSALRAMHPTTRLVHVEHSYTRSFTALNVPHKRRFFAMLRVTYSLFDQVIAVSKAQAGWMAERRLVPASKLSVISPQVDLSAVARGAGPVEAARVIGAIGRLEPQKGFDLLIEGFRMCPNPDARLVIFGEGSQRDRLAALAAGDRRIEFRGHADDPAEAYRAVDVVAMPSRWEAYGLVADEARAARRPVIVSMVDGLRDRIGASGVIPCGSDPKAWRKSIEAVLAGTPPVVPVAAPKADRSRYAQRWQQVFDPAKRL